MHIREIIAPSEAAATFVEAAVERGFQGMPWDFNGAEQAGAAGFTQSTTTRDGRRGNTAEAFIRPLLGKPNFSLELHAHVTRVIIEAGRAVGVEYTQHGERRQARADAEVIVSAGALASPKLLMLSGVGPADHLRAHGIKVIRTGMAQKCITPRGCHGTQKGAGLDAVGDDGVVDAVELLDALDDEAGRPLAADAGAHVPLVRLGSAIAVQLHAEHVQRCGRRHGVSSRCASSRSPTVSHAG